VAISAGTPKDLAVVSNTLRASHARAEMRVGAQGGCPRQSKSRAALASGEARRRFRDDFGLYHAFRRLGEVPKTGEV